MKPLNSQNQNLTPMNSKLHTPYAIPGSNPLRGTLFPFIFLLVYIFFGLELGYTLPLPHEAMTGVELPPPHEGRAGVGLGWQHFTYSFQHASFMHLLLNSISFFFFYRILRRYYSGMYIIGIAYAIAVFASFFIYYHKPVVGASAMIYAMIGMWVFVGLSLPTLPMRAWKGWGRAILSSPFWGVGGLLTISFFKPNSAAMLHLAAFLLAGGWTLLSGYLRGKSKLK